MFTSFAGSAAVTVLAVVAGGDRHPVAALAAYALPAAAVSLPARLAVTPAVAAICWLFDNGFITDRRAVLGWHGSADLWRLGILLAAAAAGSLLGAGARVRAPARAAGPPPAEELAGSEPPALPARPELTVAGRTEARTPAAAGGHPARAAGAGNRQGRRPAGARQGQEAGMRAGPPARHTGA
jgi:hypothetical protein